MVGMRLVLSGRERRPRTRHGTWPRLAPPPRMSHTGRAQEEGAIMGSSGSQLALRQLVEAHYTNLYQYAFRLSGSAADAADLTQETYCRAQEQWGQLRDPSRARNWLFAILRNAYLHRLRSERTQRAIPLDHVGELPERVGPDEPTSNDDLQSILNDMREDWRTPLILFYFEDFSYRDIAEQMDLPLGTVMSRLARAKAYLRERLRATSERLETPTRRATDG